MNKNSVIGLLILVSIVIGGYILFQKGMERAAKVPMVQKKEAIIRVRTPIANTVVTSPVSVAGEAGEGWFVADEFSVSLQDATGREVVSGSVQAQGVGTTADKRMFKGTLSFTRPETATGFMVLTNASDSRQVIKYPIAFQ